MDDAIRQAGIEVAESVAARGAGTETLDVGAIRARADAATPGPWFDWNPDDDWCMNAYAVTTSSVDEPCLSHDEKESDHGQVVALTLFQFPRVVDHEAGRWAEDAAFIASARTDVPALCAEVERLRADLESLRADKSRLERERDEVFAVVRLLIARRTGVPWTEIADREVQSWLTEAAYLGVIPAGKEAGHAG